MEGTLRDNIHRVRLNIKERNFKTAEDLLDDILDEMEEPIKESPQTLAYQLRTKLLEKIHASLDSRNYGDVQILTHTLSMLK